MAIVLTNGNLLEGDATTAAKVTYVVSGLDGTTLIRLASGQLPNSKGTLYTVVGTDVIASIIIFNTNTTAEAVNLYVQDGTASRQIIGIDALGAGYHAVFDGNKFAVLDNNGSLVQTVNVAAVEAAGLTLAAGKCIAYTTPTGDQTASGIIKTKTAGASLVFGNACYTGTDGKMEKALADDAAITIPATHMCLGTIAENATGLFLEQGEAYDSTWAFDIGKSIFLSAATAGLITKTMPTKVTGNQVQVLGTCVEAATKIFWNPSPVIVEYA